MKERLILTIMGKAHPKLTQNRKNQWLGAMMARPLMFGAVGSCYTTCFTEVRNLINSYYIELPFDDKNI
jgi:hypothetical protein